MKKYFILLLIVMLGSKGFSQIEKFPVFNGCQGTSLDEMERCFNSSVRDSIIEKFTVPIKVSSDGYTGTVNVLFFVNREGSFSIIHVNSPYTEIEKEVERVFASLPKAIPAEYNGHPVDMSFALPLNFPNPKLSYGVDVSIEEPKVITGVRRIKRPSTKKKRIPLGKKVFLKHHSELNIPFHHASYVAIEKAMLAGNSGHTAVKPYR